ncbi:MAG: DNA repair protein RecO [Acidimicrobiia bacterium]|nr:DNA repair protein RecO [Acidimicrobiia bacterium]
MALRHDQGIVLRTYSFGEADKIVVLLSATSGKLRVVAKGVRKTKSRFGGRLEPFTHVDLVLYEGRNLDTVTQVEVIESFPNLRFDLDRFVTASTMAEVADAVAQEGEPSVGLFLLLHRGLRALNDGAGGSDLVTAYLLKVAEVLGLAPALEHCAGCGDATADLRFNLAAGGAVCSTCAPAGAFRLRQGVTARMAELAASDMASIPVGDTSLEGETLGVTRRFFEHHLDRRIASLAVMHE